MDYEKSYDKLVDIILLSALVYLQEHGFDTQKPDSTIFLHINNETPKNAFHHGQFNQIAQVIISFYKETGINIFENPALNVSKKEAEQLLHMFQSYSDHYNEYKQAKD